MQIIRVQLLHKTPLNATDSRFIVKAVSDTSPSESCLNKGNPAPRTGNDFPTRKVMRKIICIPR